LNTIFTFGDKTLLIKRLHYVIAERNFWMAKKLSALFKRKDRWTKGWR